MHEWLRVSGDDEESKTSSSSSSRGEHKRGGCRKCMTVKNFANTVSRLWPLVYDARNESLCQDIDPASS